MSVIGYVYTIIFITKLYNQFQLKTTTPTTNYEGNHDETYEKNYDNNDDNNGGFNLLKKINKFISVMTMGCFFSGICGHHFHIRHCRNALFPLSIFNITNNQYKNKYLLLIQVI